MLSVIAIISRLEMSLTGTLLFATGLAHNILGIVSARLREPLWRIIADGGRVVPVSPADNTHEHYARENTFWFQFAGIALMIGIPLATAASQMGGNVRVGLEDSLFISRGKLAHSNAEQVRKVRRVIEELGGEIASPDEAREILDLKGGDRVAF